LGSTCETTAATTDFFARLCDVTPRGVSLNLTESIARLPICEHELRGDRTMYVEIHVSAVARRFEKGRRIRLQVSSGAHPRYGGNLGVEDPAAELADSQLAREEIFHSANHLSKLVIPVF
jgi:uncharacterized protein